MEGASSRPLPTRYPKPGRADHDPEALWRSFAATLRRVTGKLDDPSRVASVAVASMGEAAVPLDAAGEPTSDMIAWFYGLGRGHRRSASAALSGRTVSSA